MAAYYQGNENRSITIPVDAYNLTITVDFKLYYEWEEGYAGSFIKAEKNSVSSLLSLSDYYISYSIGVGSITVTVYAVAINGEMFQSDPVTFYVDAYGVVYP